MNRQPRVFLPVSRGGSRRATARPRARPLVRPTDPGRNRQPLRLQHGLTLVEVLITVVVFAIGLLGIAYTQNQALRTSHAAYLHTLAVMATSDAVERLWAGACEPDSAAVEAGWQAAHGDRLPGFDGSIQTAGDGFRIEVNWTDLRFVSSRGTEDGLATDDAEGVQETIAHEVQIPPPGRLGLCEEAA